MSEPVFLSLRPSMPPLLLSVVRLWSLSMGSGPAWAGAIFSTFPASSSLCPSSSSTGKLRATLALSSRLKFNPWMADRAKLKDEGTEGPQVQCDCPSSPTAELCQRFLLTRRARHLPATAATPVSLSQNMRGLPHTTFLTGTSRKTIRSQEH